MELSYILKLRRSLKDEFRHMPLFQNGSSIIVENNQGEILLQERTDRNQWCLPGGLQELGETFESVAIRELYEETGLTTSISDLILIKVVSGPSRYNTYPNGDEVYNNSVVYLVRNYNGILNNNYQEIVDNNNSLIIQKESKQLKFFKIDGLPTNLMDKDLIEAYLEFIKK
jgi:8-oxo-dGTP pyrophosphatase MutT (NUDIX family)